MKEEVAGVVETEVEVDLVDGLEVEAEEVTENKTEEVMEVDALMGMETSADFFGAVVVEEAQER